MYCVVLELKWSAIFEWPVLTLHIDVREKGVFHDIMLQGEGVVVSSASWSVDLTLDQAVLGWALVEDILLILGKTLNSHSACLYPGL